MVYRLVSLVLLSFTIPKVSLPKLLQATSGKGRISAGCRVTAPAWACWWGAMDSCALGCRQCITTGDGQQGFNQIWECLWHHWVNLICSLVNLVCLLVWGCYGLGDVPTGSSGRGTLPEIRIHHRHRRLHAWVQVFLGLAGDILHGVASPLCQQCFFSVQQKEFAFYLKVCLLSLGDCNTVFHFLGLTEVSCSPSRVTLRRSLPGSPSLACVQVSHRYEHPSEGCCRWAGGERWRGARHSIAPSHLLHTPAFYFYVSFQWSYLVLSCCPNEGLWLDEHFLCF